MRYMSPRLVSIIDFFPLRHFVAVFPSRRLNVLPHLEPLTCLLLLASVVCCPHFALFTFFSRLHIVRTSHYLHVSRALCTGCMLPATFSRACIGCIFSLAWLQVSPRLLPFTCFPCSTTLHVFEHLAPHVHHQALDYIQYFPALPPNACFSYA